MNVRQRLAGVTALAIFAAAAVFAHVRLINPSNGSPLWWQTNSNIAITINDAGSDDLADDSHFTALRNAIQEWNALDGTTMQLVENASPGAQARTDWSSSSVHLMLFDENNSSGYFPNGSGTVAITPVWFYSNGRIADADVLFNGKSFAFTTSKQPGRYDIQDVAVHELGHLLGLDHSGWAGASMFPYVDPAVILHRSLSSDEAVGMRAVYPSGTWARITGTIKRASNGSVVKGAHVVARDPGGRPVGAALTNASGVFSVQGLAAGSYTLCVNPLDFPVASFNLGSGWVIETDFESTEFGNVTLASSQVQSTGDTLVGADVSIALGRNSDPYPLRCQLGTTTNIVVRGSGLSAGSSLTSSDPNVVVTPTAWFGSQVSASVFVPSASAIGHVDLTAVNAAGDRSILTAALELTPADPGVTFVSPNQGDLAGGTNITVFGTDFNAGARVVMGGEIYIDGISGGCTVVNATTITLTTRASAVGTTDVVVIDGSGVEGRMSNGFQFLAVPVLTTLYPITGSSVGGTEIRLTGENFDFQTVVRINGVVQGSVFAATSEMLVVITEAGAAGGPYLVEVENPGGSIATSQFSYVVRADPLVTNITPATGGTAGGDVLTVEGLNFGTSLNVLFGADPNTGLGGTVAAGVIRIDANTLSVTTPPHSGGLASLIVEATDTDQAAVVSSGFTYLGAAGDGGSGGGCYTVPVQGPPDPGDVLRSVLWFALMAGGIRLLGRKKRQPVAQEISE